MAIILTTYKGRVIYYQVGAGYIQGGGSEFFWVMYRGRGVKIKIPWGRGGHIFHQEFFFVGGGSDLSPQTPHIPNDTANNIKYSK